MGVVYLHFEKVIASNLLINVCSILRNYDQEHVQFLCKAADRTDKDLCNYLGRKLQSFSFKLKHFKDSVSLSWAGAFKFMYLKTPTKLQYIGYALICV